VKDDEFEGDEQAQTPMKGDVAAPFGRLGCALVVCQISGSGIRKAVRTPCPVSIGLPLSFSCTLLLYQWHHDGVRDPELDEPRDARDCQ
jgi:hypothetical protein